jgi:ankyrin repeat protein
MSPKFRLYKSLREMLIFATIFLTVISMATSQPSLPIAEEAYSMMMSHFRSDGTAHVKINELTMLNPYHFSKGPETKDSKELAISLLDQIYAAPIGEQAALARQLGLENDKAGPYMVWDAFVTGHVDVSKALNTFLTRTIGSPGWEESINKFVNSKIEEVLQAPVETKSKAIEEFLTENAHESPQLLFEAAVHGDQVVLAHLIDAGHEIHSEEHPSNMPLHAACFNGRMGAARQLIEAGISVNHLDDLGSTPLMRAATGGNVELTEWLLQNGANATVRETRAGGSTALELGVRNATIARLLLDNGAECSPIAFASAVHWGDEEGIRILSDVGDFVPFDLEVTEGSQQEALTPGQREAVLLAIRHCASGRVASGRVVRWLIRYVATSHDGDMYHLDGSDEELLDAVRAGIGGAVRTDDVETARLLISSLPPGSLTSESRPKCDSRSGETWLSKTARLLISKILPTSFSNSMISQLTTHPRTGSYETLLLDAVHNNAQSVTRMLLEEFSLNPNAAIGPNLETPLTVAALTGHVEMIKFLASSFNASIHTSSGSYANGPTPLWHAIHSQNEAAARALFELGGPVEKIHAAIKGGEKRLWLSAGKRSEYRSPVVVMAFMNPVWYDEDSEGMFLCLEFPDGFKSELWTRKGDEELAAGDERPLMVDEGKGGQRERSNAGAGDL